MFRSQNSPGQQAQVSACAPRGQPTGQLVTVRLPDGRLVQGERLADGPGGGSRARRLRCTTRRSC